MSDGSTVWVPVLPSLKDFAGRLRAGTQGAGQAVGEAVGKDLAAGVEKSTAAVEKSAELVAKAQSKAADAAGKVRVEEQKLEETRAKAQTASKNLDAAEKNLADLRASGTASSKELEAAEKAVETARAKSNSAMTGTVTAEERLEAARRKSVEASAAAEKADGALTDAKSKLAAAELEVANATELTAEEMATLTEQQEKAEQASADLESVQGKLAIGFAAVAAAALGVVTGLVAVGGQFDDMYDTIRIGTGASGEAFEHLQQSARDIADVIPAMDGGFEQVGSTLADLNTRTGATGAVLEEMTKQFIALSNMGVDADINDITGAFTAYGTVVDEMPQALDDLHAIQQATGVSMTSLAQSLEKGGPALREFGFSLNSSAGLVGALDKAGIDADKTIAGMAKGLGQFVKAGEAPEQAMWRTISSIEEMMDAGNKMEAQDLAMKLLGPKNFAPFLEAIENGTFAFDDMMDSLGASEDTILGLHEETSDWAESWQLVKQQAMLAVEPLAAALFDQLGPAIEFAGEWLQKIVGFVGDNQTAFTAFAVVVGGMAIGFGAYTIAMKAWTVAVELAKVAQTLLNGSFKASGIGLIITLVAGLVAGIVYLATQTEFFQKTWEIVWGAIKKAFEVVWNFIKNNWQTILAVLTGPIGIAVKMIVSNWDKISAAFQAVWDFVKNITGIFVDWIVAAWDGFISFFTEMPGRIASVASTMWDSVTNAVNTAKDWIVGKFDELVGFVTGLPGKIATAASGMWDGIKDAFKGAINWIIRAWNSVEFKIPGFSLGPVKWDGFTLGVPKIPEFYTGGIIPGYTPGVDTTVIAAGGGEAVMRPEWTRAVGPDYVNAANAAARAGGIPGVERFLGAYKDGGIVGREPYGLPTGTNTGGFGSSGAAFPGWVHEIEAQHSVRASTYPGHQERDGLNKGIDWVGTVPAMHAFAEWLAGIGEQLEQVIWEHPQTGQKIGIADGVPVGPGTSQPGYYSSDWAGHRDHVHTRQSYEFGQVEKIEPEQFMPESTQVILERESIERPDAVTSTTQPGVSPSSSSDPTTVEGIAGKIAGDFATETAGDFLAIWGLDGITLPSAEGEQETAGSDAVIESVVPQAVGAEPSVVELQAPAVEAIVEDPAAGLSGHDLYAYRIAEQAKSMGLPRAAADIGGAAAIVEVGNPLRMFANSKLPESLKLPHDAVGSDGTSVGLFQQQNFAEWGTLADRMDPAASARMFYEHFPAGWESMDPGSVAQAVQRSSLPYRYSQEMDAGRAMIGATGVYDDGGMLLPDQLAYNASGLREPYAVFSDDQWGTLDDLAERRDTSNPVAVEIIDRQFSSIVAALGGPPVGTPAPGDVVSSGGTVQITIQINGAQSPEATGRAVADALEARMSSHAGGREW